MADEQIAKSSLRTYRWSLAAGAALYLSWWVVVEALLPGAFNPLPGRLLVVASFLAVLAATFVSAWAERQVAFLVSASMWGATLHYFYLLHGNHGDPTWWAGCVVTVACVCAMLQTRGALVSYSVFALGEAAVLMALEHRLASSIFFPSILTVLLLSNVALRSRLRAEHEWRTARDARLERDRAQEANEFKSMFLSLVSHELITPLQSMRLSLDVLGRVPEAQTARCVDSVTRLGRGHRRLTDLIESLLEYSQIEAGRLNVEPSELDLGALVRETTEELTPQAAAKGLDLRLRIESLPPLRSDPKLLRVLVVNLVTNAVKYTERGWIEVAVAPDPSGQRISVKDTGRGISPADREHIFEAFTQLEPLEGKHLPGVGLGLALVKQMAAALGAQIALSSVVGEGSTFTIVLPASPALA